MSLAALQGVYLCHAPENHVRVKSDAMMWAAGEVICRHFIGEPVSTPMVSDSNRRQAYVTTLRGTILAFAYSPGCSAVTQAWTATAGGPVFSTPAFLPASDSLVVASVHGSVHCFSSTGGQSLTHLLS